MVTKNILIITTAPCLEQCCLIDDDGVCSLALYNLLDLTLCHTRESILFRKLCSLFYVHVQNGKD